VSETIPLAVTPRKLAIGEPNIFFLLSNTASLKIIYISCLALYIFYVFTCSFLACLFPFAAPLALFAHRQIQTHLGLDSNSDAHLILLLTIVRSVGGTLPPLLSMNTPGSKTLPVCGKPEHVLLHLFGVFVLSYNQLGPVCTKLRYI
jgi:hypothetical protein